MRILITRPQEDAEPLIAKLKGRNIEATALPLLKIVPASHGPVPQGPFQAICVTSANALRRTEATAEMLATPLLTVGPQSLAEAKQRGYARASAHGGDVHGLAAYVKANLDPKAGPILYLAGDQVSADLNGLLTRAGFQVIKHVAYEAQPQTPVNFAAALQTADAVMLYSPRTAKIFAALVLAQELENAANNLHYYCLSANVAAQLPQHWRKQTAAAANEQAMLAMLD